MKVTFYGAAHEVTGSCHLLEVEEQKILVDCGMFQGRDINEDKNIEPFPFDVRDIDAVLLTHAHLDHTGRVPKLIKEGYQGPVYATRGSCELAALIWRDAEHIMAYNERKFKRPKLYDLDDVERAETACRGVDYHAPFDIGGVRIVFKDAGHIFGAAFIEVTGEGKTVAFSGDIGNVHVPILRETDPLGSVDVLVCESTYGNRLHETRDDSKALFVKLVKEACARGGTIMIPAFSLERTQELLYDIHTLKETDPSFPKMPIYLDSPLAIDATAVYKKYPEYYDRDASKHFSVGDDFLDFEGLVITRTRDESKKINDAPSPKMIIAGAGMMNGGRILHHAKRYLPDPNSTLIIVGYQAQGTLGRRLYEGAEQVTIHDAPVDVNATVKAIGGLSAHGDRAKLLSWVRNAEQVPGVVYCVHGEPESATALAHAFRDELGIKAIVPEWGDRREW